MYVVLALLAAVQLCTSVHCCRTASTSLIIIDIGNLPSPRWCKNRRVNYPNFWYIKKNLSERGVAFTNWQHIHEELVFCLSTMSPARYSIFLNVNKSHVKTTPYDIWQKCMAGMQCAGTWGNTLPPPNTTTTTTTITSPPLFKCKADCWPLDKHWHDLD